MTIERFIDLRSDTVTKPTSLMREAMFRAEVGDDVFGEDPTVGALEKKAAGLTGKEAALFVPTGTMGNQIAIRVHTKPGDEVILESHCHIYDYELGMLADFSGVMPRVLEGEYGFLDPGKVRKAVRPDVYYVSRTGLICLENTVNMAGGRVYPIEIIREISSFVKERSIPMHLDGARIFNAAVASGISAAEISGYFDSVMFCLSKGLCAPVGSMLAGSSDFIDKARVVRKRLGGGMRQAGIIAAAGIAALDTMIGRLDKDHRNARALADGIAGSRFFNINPGSVETNIVICSVKGGFDSSSVLELLKSKGILGVPVSEEAVRFVTHNDVSAGDISESIQVINNL